MELIQERWRRERPIFGLHLADEARLLPELEPGQHEQLVDLLRALLEGFGDTALE
ncbi:hypothetical protein ABT337_18025 [Saccharopolyspora hirsuta]|uniref:hypothetical protein n=1 Tax=Saccharopolyspora hirsuta TaxID=1837 RepID=UPI0014796408|nr:hypothetical protein [Saccharopolyspora hirsuta]